MQIKIIATSLILFLSILSFAQPDSITTTTDKNKRTSLGVNISHFTNFNLNYTDGFSFVSAVVISKRNYSIALGPIWWLDRNNYVNFFKGGMLSFQLYPNKTNKRINFYFIDDLSYTFEKYNWEKQIDLTPNKYYDVSFKSTWHALENQTGYGFNFRVYKGFYINQSMTIGFEFYNYTSKTIVKDNPSMSSEYSTGNILSGSNTKGYLKIGLGYNFK